MWVLVLFTIMGVNGNKSCIEAGHAFVAQNRVKDFRADGNLWQVDLGHRFHCVEIGK